MRLLRFRHLCCDPQMLGSSISRTAPCWRAWWTRDPRSNVPRSSRVARRWNLPRLGTGERASRPASEFADVFPCLAARVREVGGIYSFLPSLLLLLPWAEIVGTKRFCQSQSPLGLGWRSPRGSRIIYPSLAHSSSDGHVGYIVWSQKVGSRKNPGMPYQCLMCLEMVIYQRIHLWEGKSTTNQPCESSNASPDRCGQEHWASAALWGRADVVTAGTFLEHVCPAAGCPGRNSRRPGLGWCRRSIGERRSWVFPLDCTTV